MKLHHLLLSITLLALSPLAPSAEVAITMDDFDAQGSMLLSPSERNEKILSTLSAHNLKAHLFVTCKFIKSIEARKLLKKWNESGHILGNHTFSHPYFGQKISVLNFIKEIQSCENELKSFSHFKKIFRFPMLAEGDTIKKRDELRQWLIKNDYAIGHVTIDASDWYIDQRMRKKISSDSQFDLMKYRDFYLAHIWDRAQFYNGLSKKVLGREVKHTLLIHFNLLNALFLNDIIKMFKQKGWKLIDAETAFKDEVFQSAPGSMPSGQSLIWALARESGKFESELRYPGEDESYEKATMNSLGL